MGTSRGHHLLFVGSEAARGGRRAGAGRFAAALLAVVCCASAVPSAAQSDSVTIVPADQYAAGSLHRGFFGTDYRDLWTMPIRVPVLDLDAVGGGLRPTEVGGGRQTRSLRFFGTDGREYRFRTVQKRPERATDPEFEGALAGKLIQDQVSSLLPAAPVPAARLAIAAGLYHPLPVLYVMPDDPALGEFREEFAGTLGTLEEHPDELETGGPGFAGFDEIADTESLLETLASSQRDRVDTRTYLTARLVDLILGDWDRRADQWRWARIETPSGFLWTPIPRDRDYAFTEFDGLFLSLVRMRVANAVRFSGGYRDLEGLLFNAIELDRRLLAEIDRVTWDSITVATRSALTDEEIDAAVAAMPVGFVESRGEELRSRLRVRRDSLPAASAEFYRRIAAVPQIHTSDEAETAVVARLPTGDVELSVLTSGGDRYFERSFDPSETREIHLFLEGGNDRAVVRGSSARGGIRVRVIGGGGDDVLTDSSSVARGGSWTSLHDADGENVLAGVGSTVVDIRPFKEPASLEDALIPSPPPQPGTVVSFAPVADYSTTRGFILGAGITSTRNAFRREPYATQLRLDGRFSTRWLDVELRGAGRFQSARPELSGEAEIVASRIDALRFYGFGNETRAELPSDLYVVRRELLEGTALLRYEVGAGTSVGAGVVSLYSRPGLVDGGPLDTQRPAGVDATSIFGVRGALDMDHDDGIELPSFAVGLLGSVYPFTSEGGSSFVDLEGRASVRVPLSAGGATSVAARVGGQKVWGDHPFFKAAFLGGRETLRGFPDWRFAGDAMVYGGAEASAYMGRVPIVLNWRVSPFVFFDAGRVFLEGEDSGRWHSAPGAGVSFAALNAVVRFSYAHGPEPRLYAELRAAAGGAASRGHHPLGGN